MHGPRCGTTQTLARKCSSARAPPSRRLDARPASRALAWQSRAKSPSDRHAPPAASTKCRSVGSSTAPNQRRLASETSALRARRTAIRRRVDTNRLFLCAPRRPVRRTRPTRRPAARAWVAQRQTHPRTEIDQMSVRAGEQKTKTDMLFEKTQSFLSRANIKTASPPSSPFARTHTLANAQIEIDAEARRLMRFPQTTL